MKHHTWQQISPLELRVGDVIMCFRHDDQWEQAEARIVDLCVIGPGEYVWNNGYRKNYQAYIMARCRHVGLKHLDATGGPEFDWGFFDWNHAYRWDL